MSLPQTISIQVHASVGSPSVLICTDKASTNCTPAARYRRRGIGMQVHLYLTHVCMSHELERSSDIDELLHVNGHLAPPLLIERIERAPAQASKEMSRNEAEDRPY